RVADWLRKRDGARPLLVVGLLANKDARGFLAALAPTGCAMMAVPVPGHDSHPPEDLARLALDLGFPAAGTASGMEAAVKGAGAHPVAILGSLYLAGEALRANDQIPD
ncbi:MAG TPA: bifunctional folylpolyglutamate synthase/dihydrofolate synthase, partial [Sphingomicrobium sp.]|nr:bifunctional folylpolyglutamate synthase/dihydrofolate synthase [Sphingomicrobium sp.]